MDYNSRPLKRYRVAEPKEMQEAYAKLDDIKRVIGHLSRVYENTRESIRELELELSFDVDSKKLKELKELKKQLKKMFRALNFAEQSYYQQSEVVNSLLGLSD